MVLTLAGVRLASSPGLLTTCEHLGHPLRVSAFLSPAGPHVMGCNSLTAHMSIEHVCVKLCKHSGWQKAASQLSLI